MTQNHTPHVEIRSLSHAYGRSGPLVLDSVSFTIDRGQALALVGRSGCGKSTMLHLIAGLGHPRSGQVLIGGKAVTKPSPRWNMMFQSPSLFPWMSAAENVGLGLRYAGQGRDAIRARVAELLHLVHLEEFAEANVQTLSGGQQQRVALARSLATSPEVLLLDEPFSALDPFTRATLQQEVRAIARQLGLTLVIVTHDVDEALIMADRALVMAPNPGRIVADIPIAPAASRDGPAFAEMRQRVLQPFEASHGLEPTCRAKDSGRTFTLLPFLPRLGRKPSMRVPSHGQRVEPS